MSEFEIVMNIYVLPEWKRRGAAEAVMRAQREEARKRGVGRVGLHASVAGAVYAGLVYVAKNSCMETDLAPDVARAVSR